jgi:AmpD protein
MMAADWQLDQGGWLNAARHAPSPHCDERPPEAVISMAVIHAISLPPGEFGGDAVERFFAGSLDPAAHPYFREIHAQRVSAHFFIRRDGTLIQFVPCALRAWHAGVSVWQGRERCNDFSIGIELEGCDELAFAPVQYAVLARLLTALRGHFPIRDIVGHADIAPGRKTDPGPYFDWSGLRAMLPR